MAVSPILKRQALIATFVIGTLSAVVPTICGAAQEVSIIDAANVQAEKIAIFPLPREDVVRRYLAVAGGNDSARVVTAVAGEVGVLVYENTLGNVAVGPSSSNPTAQLADDISTTAAYGCALDRYVVRVTGDLNGDGVAEPLLGIHVSLYPGCPRGGATAIDGTTCHFILLGVDAGGPVDLVCAIASDTVVPLPTNLYVGVTFDRGDAGVVLGAPAQRGFSMDRFDHPVAPCGADLGGFPNGPHASFYGQIYVREPCGATFPGYRNTQQSERGFSPGAQVRFADDIHLAVADCNMVAYEVSVKGVTTGAIVFDLRTELTEAESPVISGTAGAVVVNVLNTALIGRMTFDPPIPIPQDLWITFKTTSARAGPIRTGKPAGLGSTEDFYMEFRDNAWQRQGADTDGIHEAFDVTIICEGAPPTGACCDMILLNNGICVGGDRDGAACTSNPECSPYACRGDSVCRELPEMNCAFPPLWTEGGVCDAQPFPHPCGQAACCTPDDTCVNLTAADCAALSAPGEPVFWRRGSFCETEGFQCPFYACLRRVGECMVQRPELGCEDPFCCSAVCENDPWCCRVEWDRVCLREAAVECYPRPAGDACWSSSGADEARLLEVNRSAVVNNHSAWQSPDDPELSCHFTMEPACVGGTLHGIPCAKYGYCFTGTCTGEVPVYGAPGFRTLWFKFVAEQSSARLNTCNSDAGVDDTVIAVYSVGDPTTPQSACETLTEIACNHDHTGCGTGRGSDLCVEGLNLGETYYVQVAVSNPELVGVVELDLESPCPSSADHEDVDGPTPHAGVVLFASFDRLPDASPVLVDANPSRFTNASPTRQALESLHREMPNDLYMPRPAIPPSGAVAHAGPWVRDGFASIQVNVDADGINIVGDTANEPSIAVDPTNSDRIVIGFRQFDSLESDFRQGGWGYSHDGGASWTFPGVLEPGIFRSDPVLDSDANGVLYYYSLFAYPYTYDLFRSFDGGVTWPLKTFAYGGDKGWMVVDKTDGPGSGNIYSYWSLNESCCSDGHFTRSTDGGQTFMPPILIPESPYWGTMAIGAQSELYVVGNGGVFTKSLNAWDSNVTPAFEPAVHVDLGGSLLHGYDAYGTPNPGGGSSSAISGQMWVASGRSPGSTRENVYVLASVTNADEQDPLDVMFSRSTDGGRTWSGAMRINDDPPGNGAYQWFGTMSVAPSGRIDVVWNDTRNSGNFQLSETFYAYSVNGGRTWSQNVPVSPMWDSYIGWPGGNNKIGDYYHMISDNHYAKLAYAATFNGEQDVYFLRIPPTIDCNHNSVVDAEDLTNGTSLDCSDNGVPDECEPDFDADGITDSCDDDFDNDGVLNDSDECDLTVPGSLIDGQGRPLADTNENCEVGYSDFWRFRNCLVNGRLGVPAPREACMAAFDYDGDEVVTLRDFAVFERAFTAAQP